VKPTGGMPNFKKHSKQVNLGIIFDWGVREEDTILIWGYAEEYNPDLGVREYKKVENPCTRPWLLAYKFLLTQSDHIKQLLPLYLKV
jgi:hypothetical protein